MNRLQYCKSIQKSLRADVPDDGFRLPSDLHTRESAVPDNTVGGTEMCVRVDHIATWGLDSDLDQCFKGEEKHEHELDSLSSY